MERGGESGRSCELFYVNSTVGARLKVVLPLPHILSKFNIRINILSKTFFYICR